MPQNILALGPWNEMPASVIALCVHHRNSIHSFFHKRYILKTRKIIIPVMNDQGWHLDLVKIGFLLPQPFMQPEELIIAVV